MHFSSKHNPNQIKHFTDLFYINLKLLAIAEHDSKMHDKLFFLLSCVSTTEEIH
jgi:hypothetical protein